MNLKNTSIKDNITSEDIKKIFSNAENKKRFIERKEIKNINLRGYVKKDELDNIIIENWNYDTDKKIIRKLFNETKTKYFDLQEYQGYIDKIVSDWKAEFKTDVKWPFSQGEFDKYIQNINKKEKFNFENYKEFDNDIKENAIKYRRYKILNTIINDYIEKKIIDSNEEIIPTFSDKKSVDFYIDGVKFDQKVSKSPTDEFIEKYGDDYMSFAIKNPNVVAKYLYELQKELRFDDNNRLYVVFLSKDKFNTNLKDLDEYLDNVKSMEPMDIKFEYKHKDSSEKNEYNAKSYVILIS